jgi:hypothetical protein
VAGSFGFQFGAQAKTIILVFLDEEALKRFRASEGWKAGVDGSRWEQAAISTRPKYVIPLLASSSDRRA